MSNNSENRTLWDHHQENQPPWEKRQQCGFRKVEICPEGRKEYVLISPTATPPVPKWGKAPPANTVHFPSWRAARRFCLPVTNFSICDSYKLSLHETVSWNELFPFPLHRYLHLTISTRAKPSPFIDQPTINKGSESPRHPLKAVVTWSPLRFTQFNYTSLKHYIP